MRTQMRWNGKQVTATIRAAAAEGLAQAAEHVLEESRRVVPIEEGTLDRSGTASSDPATLTAAVSYDTPYAVRQHEDTGLRHAKGRTAKYLETPLTTTTDVQAEIIADTIRAAVEGGSPSKRLVSYTNAKGVTRQVTAAQARVWNNLKRPERG